MRIAVADLGTNSTRLLIADAEPGAPPREVSRHTTVTRLGEGVDASGQLSPAAVERVAAAVAGYRELADAAGAQRRIAVATSAVRESANGSDLTDLLRDRHGFDVRTIDGDEETRLTFLGATAGRAAHPDGDTLVVDIGGGSTEFVAGRPVAAPAFHVSTRLGSVRQTERHLAHDPPHHHELEQLADEACATIADAVGPSVRERVGEILACAGTATSLAAIDLELDPYDPDQVDGHRLELATCERILARLAQVDVDHRRRTVGLLPDRAPTIVAGVVILVEALRLFGVPVCEVSEADILDGAAIDAVS